MIPKIIHICWFGGKEMPVEHQNYINHWKELLPDYKFMVWNEETFGPYIDLSRPFAKETYEKKIYGFFSDFVRFTVLYKFGGIYLDTDVEMLKSIDVFTKYKMFMGFIFDSSIGTAVIGSEPKNELFLKWLDVLDRDFVNKQELTISNNWVTEYFIKNVDGFLLNGKRQSLSCGIEIFPKDYFERFKVNKKSEGGYCEHHCYGSWNDDKPSLAKKVLKKILPRRLVSILGHKSFLKKTPFYDVYLRDRKIK